MKTSLITRAVTVAAGLALLAAPALADPVIDRIDTEVRKRRQLRVVVQTTTTEKATVFLTGTVNGREFSLKKKLRKAGSKAVPFTVDAKKLKLKKLTEDIRFENVVAQVVEKSGPETERELDDTSIPVPLVLIRGLGNENTPGAFQAFATTLDATAGGRYEALGENPAVVVQEYPSLTESLPQHAKRLRKTVKQLLRRSSFRQVDMVGYSMGGLVARTFLADGKGRGKVRRLVMLGTPNQGAPVAYVGAGLVEQDLLTTLLAGQEFADLGLVDGLLGDDTTEALRVFYPTYSWAFTTGFLGRQPIPNSLLAPLLGDATAPLTGLNSVAPDAALDQVHSLAYSSLPADEFTGLGTLDEVDLDIATLIGGNGLADLDLVSLLSGDGDGVVPLRSAFFQEVPAWAAVTTTHDMGAGTHVTMPADPAVILRVVQLLTGTEL